MPLPKYDELAGMEFRHSQEDIQLNDFQQRVCAVPENWNLALTGGRGGGKSYAIAILILRHIVRFGDRSRVLFVRQTHQGCEDFVLILRELFARIWGAAVTYNANSGIWRGFPNGGYLEINQLSSYAEYAKFQGRSFTMIACDEATNWPNEELLNLLRSNLRGAAEVPKRMILAANPGGIGHTAVYRRHVLKAVPGRPYELDGETWVTCPSTFEGNIFIDREKYRRDLVAATGHDKELARAFIDGDWDVVRGGSFFAGCMDEKRVMFSRWRKPDGVTAREWLRPKAVAVGDGIRLEMPDIEQPFRFYLSMDWGFSAPCVVFLCARSNGAEVEGKYYPRGSVLLLDCFDTALVDRLHVGAEMPVSDVAAKVRAMCQRWGVSPAGVADDAAGIRNQDGVSVVDSFADEGVYFREAGKGSRIGGWTRMREMLNDAGKPDKPGLYVSDLCTGFWQTVPFLSRSMRHVEDLEGNDHWADAARYAVIGSKFQGWRQREF